MLEYFLEDFFEQRLLEHFLEHFLEKDLETFGTMKPLCTQRHTKCLFQEEIHKNTGRNTDRQEKIRKKYEIEIYLTYEDDI